MASVERAPKKFRDKACKDCGAQFTPTGPNQQRCASCKRAAVPSPARSQAQAEYVVSRRQRVFAYYGEACACCGTTERLTIDHVEGDGKQHREEIGCSTGASFYAWIIRNNFPPGLQTLCLRCNRSKRDGPRCTLSHSIVADRLAAKTFPATESRIPPLDIEWRAGGGLAAWLRAEAKRRGTTHRAILTEALHEHRLRIEAEAVQVQDSLRESA